MQFMKMIRNGSSHKKAENKNKGIIKNKQMVATKEEQNLIKTKK